MLILALQKSIKFLILFSLKLFLTWFNKWFNSSYLIESSKKPVSFTVHLELICKLEIKATHFIQYK